MENIDDAIKAAMEQEKLTRDDYEERLKKQADDELRAVISETLKDEIKTYKKVTIYLDEYIELKMRAHDLNRILKAIMESLELNYNKERLNSNGDGIAETFKVLYPDVYDGILADRLDAEG